MSRFLFAALATIHGLLHLMGFSKAFNYGQNNSISKHITKAVGIMWLVTALLLIVSAILIVLKKDWWYLGVISVILSQILIVTSWKDAKFGTIINVIILLFAVINFAGWKLQYFTRKEANVILRSSGANVNKLTSGDIHLQPPVVQKWLIHT